MGTIKIDFDVKVWNDKEYIPFEQVMQLLRELDEHAPNVDLTEIAKNLEDQKKQAKAGL